MSALPTGTVTLLFTDIEGSTRLLQQLGDGYRAVIADHHRLLRAAIEIAGHVVEDRGDGLFAVFGRATDALEAAADAQRALTAHPWPADGVVRVRMGLHTGEPALVGANYVGLDVHRAARLCDAGHGGQVLLSVATRELVEGQLPDGVTLLDLGEHRLRDLQRSERLFQATIAGLPDAFPAPRSVSRRPNNLPTSRDPIIGRDADVTAARTLLLRDDVGLVTLTGPGGSGKTRLGLQVASTLLDQFEDGVFLVMLAPVVDPALVPATIAQALGVQEEANRPPVETVQRYLRDKEVLLLLDNFEQVLAAAPTVAELLASCPRVKALVTSRAALRVRGERELAVPPLALPEAGALLSAERLGQFTAVALFAERAREESGPDFAITTENAPAVAEICQQLDGLPLAIELAAARTRLMSPQAMLGRLGRRLTFLTGGSRDLPTRQQTLRDTIGWSYDLLSEEEQRLFRGLGVFVGGCGLDGVEQVGRAPSEAGDDRESSADPFEVIASLVDKSLLKQADDPSGEPRFSMLATVREFALEQLEAAGEIAATRVRHAEYFTRLVEEAEPAMRAATDSRWFDRLDADRGNLRAALAWCDEADAARHLLRELAGGLWMFWWQRGYWSEGKQWQERAIAVDAEPSVRLLVLNGRAILAVQGGELGRALAIYEEVERLGRANDDLSMRAFGMMRQAFVQSQLGEIERAEVLAREGHALALELGDPWRIASALNSLGRVAMDRGDLVQATEIVEEGLRLTRQAGIAYMVPYMLQSLAAIATSRRDFARATALLEEGSMPFRQRSDRWGLQVSLGQLVRIAILQGDRDRAASIAHENLLLIRTIGSLIATHDHLAFLAWVARVDGLPIRAARLLGAADAIRETTGLRPRAERQQQVDDEIALLRSQLDATAFQAAWDEGRALTVERATRYALEEIEL